MLTTENQKLSIDLGFMAPHRKYSHGEIIAVEHECEVSYFKVNAISVCYDGINERLLDLLESRRVTYLETVKDDLGKHRRDTGFKVSRQAFDLVCPIDVPDVIEDLGGIYGLLNEASINSVFQANNGMYEHNSEFLNILSKTAINGRRVPIGFSDKEIEDTIMSTALVVFKTNYFVDNGYSRLVTNKDYVLMPVYNMSTGVVTLVYVKPTKEDLMELADDGLISATHVEFYLEFYQWLCSIGLALKHAILTVSRLH